MTKKPHIFIGLHRSLKGCGAFCKDQNITQNIFKLEVKEDINILELRIVKFAKATFTKLFPIAKIIHLKMKCSSTFLNLENVETHNKIL